MVTLEGKERKDSYDVVRKLGAAVRFHPLRAVAEAVVSGHGCVHNGDSRETSSLQCTRHVSRLQQLLRHQAEVL